MKSAGTGRNEDSILILPGAISDFIELPHSRNRVTGKILLNDEPLRVTAVFPDDPQKPAVILMIERDSVNAHPESHGNCR